MKEMEGIFIRTDGVWHSGARDLNRQEDGSFAIMVDGYSQKVVSPIVVG